jgi:hypothetical protein
MLTARSALLVSLLPKAVIKSEFADPSSATLQTRVLHALYCARLWGLDRLGERGFYWEVLDAVYADVIEPPADVGDAPPGTEFGYFVVGRPGVLDATELQQAELVGPLLASPVGDALQAALDAHARCEPVYDSKWDVPDAELDRLLAELKDSLTFGDADAAERDAILRGIYTLSPIRPPYPVVSISDQVTQARTFEAAGRAFLASGLSEFDSEWCMQREERWAPLTAPPALVLHIGRDITNKLRDEHVFKFGAGMRAYTRRLAAQCGRAYREVSRRAVTRGAADDEGAARSDGGESDAGSFYSLRSDVSPLTAHHANEIARKIKLQLERATSDDRPIDELLEAIEGPAPAPRKPKAPRRRRKGGSAMAVSVGADATGGAATAAAGLASPQLPPPVPPAAGTAPASAPPSPETVAATAPADGRGSGVTAAARATAAAASAPSAMTDCDTSAAELRQRLRALRALSRVQHDEVAGLAGQLGAARAAHIRRLGAAHMAVRARHAADVGGGSGTAPPQGSPHLAQLLARQEALTAAVAARQAAGASGARVARATGRRARALAARAYFTGHAAAEEAAAAAAAQAAATDVAGVTGQATRYGEDAHAAVGEEVAAVDARLHAVGEAAALWRAVTSAEDDPRCRLVSMGLRGAARAQARSEAAATSAAVASARP